MSKNKNRNKNRQNAPGVVMTPSQPDTGTVTEPEETSPVEGEETSLEDVFAQAMENKEETTPAKEAEAPAEEVPAVEEQPSAPPDGPTPSAIEIKQIKLPARKVMAEDLLPTKISPMQRCVMSQAQLHTPAGLKLLEMFKEYKTAMSVKTTDRYEHSKRAKMLAAIVQQTCPYKLKNTQVGKDLVMIFFNELMEGWGKIYTDSSIFRLDYSLGNPAVIDKMDIFTGAMIQLVEAATGASDHIAFMNDRLAKIIDSPAVMTAIENLRVGIEKRLAQKRK